METIFFGWFGRRVRVAVDRPALAGRVRALLGHLDGGGSGSPLDLALRLDEPEGPVAELADRLRPLDAAQPEAHALTLLFETLFAEVGGCFVFHAAAVARDERALVISAPSSFGKTTLTLHLALRGWALLSDDVTPLDRKSGRVLPFPRAITLRPGTRAMLPSGALDRARAARLGGTDDEWLVDPVRFIGPPGPPSRPAMVVLVRSREDGQDVRRFPWIEIRLREAFREDGIRDLRGLPGVADVAEPPGREGVVFVRLEPSASIDSWLRTHQADVVSAVKHPVHGARFEEEPAMWRIGPFQAALELAQEMLNRCQGSRVEKEFHGREPLLVAEIAALLRDARCLAVVPGPLPEMLERIERAFAEVPA